MVAVLKPLAVRALLVSSLLLASVWLASAEQWDETMQQIKALESQGRFAEAHALEKEALNLAIKRYGKNDPRVALNLNNLGGYEFDAGRYEEARALSLRALDIETKHYGKDSEQVAGSLVNLAWTERAAGRSRDAEKNAERALKIYRRKRNQEEIARCEDLLGTITQETGRFAEAEQHLRSALETRGRLSGPNSPAVAQTQSRLAAIALARGNDEEAERLYRKSVAILEAKFGAAAPALLNDLISLAEINASRGRQQDADQLFGRCLKIATAGEPDPASVAHVLESKARVEIAQGRLAEAEASLAQRLSVVQAASGKSHATAASALLDLAMLYREIDNYERAQSYAERAVSVFQQSAPDSPAALVAQHNLALILADQGNFDAARPILEDVLAQRQRMYGELHPSTAATLNVLGSVYLKSNRQKEGLDAVNRALSIRRKLFPPGHPALIPSLVLAATVFRAGGQYDVAERASREALAIQEKTMGAHHRDFGVMLAGIGMLQFEQGRLAESLRYFERANHIFASWRFDSAGRQAEDDPIDLDLDRFHEAHLIALSQAAQERTETVESLAARSYAVGQLARDSSASRALAKSGARLAGTDPALGRLVRAHQDLERKTRKLERRYIEQLAQLDRGESAVEASAKRELTLLDQERLRLEERLRREFPTYWDLVAPKPLLVAETQALLAPDECLIVFYVGQKSAYAWVVTRDEMRWHRLDATPAALEDKTQRLRAALGPRSSGARGFRPVGEERYPPFDVGLANAVYVDLFGHAGLALDRARKLVVVPSGVLASVPFNLLVAEIAQKPAAGTDDYAKVGWLARHKAVSVLPSVTSLRALRGTRERRAPERAFLGIGNPTLRAPTPEDPALVAVAGSIAGAAAVPALPALPETQRELQEIAAALHAPASDLLLAERATEASLRATRLDRYRVVVFATHALVAGELPGLSEPALILSPPPKGGPDDGLLTATEVMDLHMNADWVVLSACNTAAGEGAADTRDFSGLAKAFFFAGARTLLVSHWPVDSAAAAALTTSTFRELERDPSLGPAEALRRAMVAMMDDTSGSWKAHPSIWAPFVVVGEGGPAATGAKR